MKRGWQALIAATMALTLGSASGGAQVSGVVPHAPVQIDGATAVAEFHIIGDQALLTARLADGSVRQIRVFSDVGDAMAVLADQRLSFAWPALLAWAGNDLIILRDKALARTRNAAEAGIVAALPKGQSEQWAGDEQLAAILQLSRILANSGRAQEAVTMLRQALAKPVPDTKSSYWRPFLVNRLAGILFEYGRADAAITLLDRESQAMPEDSPYKLNLDVNLAQYLIRTGHYQRGLLLIQAAWQQFGGQADTDEAERVPDSDAQFAWIKACALNGLGRHDQARALVDGIDRGAPRGAQVSVTASARINAFLCMRDAVGLAAELQAQLATAPLAGDLFLSLQPSSERYPPDAATLAAALKRPELAKAMMGKVRNLDPQFAAALRGWAGSGLVDDID